VTGARAGLRVLVADDEAPARRVLVRLLEAHQDIHVVAECADGANAALRIRDVRPELIFLDVKMPRATPASPRPRARAMTAPGARATSWRSLPARGAGRPPRGSC
jgi:CheY-like chemotaxis protein